MRLIEDGTYIIDVSEADLDQIKRVMLDTGKYCKLMYPDEEWKKGDWIPCSERLPEEDLWTGMGKQFSNSVLMTMYDKNDEDLIVDYGHTTDGEWYSETADEYIESIADWKVVAWMPLPEPYKGEIKNETN